MTIRLHRGDLPDLSRYGGAAVAVDTETMGLRRIATGCAWSSFRPATAPPTWSRSRRGQIEAPNLEAAAWRPAILKIFHFARFDFGILCNAFGVMPAPVYCTRMASRLVRTYTDKHGLKDLARELLGVDLSKQQQLSDWGAETLSDAQLAYAASDVLHLHALMDKLDAMLAREGRTELAAACFRFLPDRARLDLAGWAGEDIFAHS